MIITVKKYEELQKNNKSLKIEIKNLKENNNLLRNELNKINSLIETFDKEGDTRKNFFRRVDDNDYYIVLSNKLENLKKKFNQTSRKYVESKSTQDNLMIAEPTVLKKTEENNFLIDTIPNNFDYMLLKKKIDNIKPQPKHKEMKISCDDNAFRLSCKDIIRDLQELKTHSCKNLKNPGLENRSINFKYSNLY